MRTTLAVLLAIATFFATDYCLQRLGEMAGVKSSVTYPEPIIREAYDQEYEDFGGTTTFGYSVAAFSIVIAVWVAKAISTGSAWNHTFTKTGRRYWFAWLAGTFTIAVIFAASSLLFSKVSFPYKGLLWLTVECAVLLVVVFLAQRWAKTQPDTAANEA